MNVTDINGNTLVDGDSVKLTKRSKGQGCWNHIKKRDRCKKHSGNRK